jgi:hypothetical protein
MTLVTLIRLSKSNDLVSLLTNLGRDIEAKLHTATSSLSVYSSISVHKLEDLIVPKFYWLDFLLQESLYNM